MQLRRIILDKSKHSISTIVQISKLLSNISNFRVVSKMRDRISFPSLALYETMMTPRKYIIRKRDRFPKHLRFPNCDCGTSALPRLQIDPSSVDRGHSFPPIITRMDLSHSFVM